MESSSIFAICAVGVLMALLTHYYNGISLKLNTEAPKEGESLEDRVANLERAVVALAGKGAGDGGKGGEPPKDGKDGKAAEKGGDAANAGGGGAKADGKKT